MCISEDEGARWSGVGCFCRPIEVVFECNIVQESMDTGHGRICERHGICRIKQGNGENFPLAWSGARSWKKK
jgi:hypothetical protein